MMLYDPADVRDNLLAATLQHEAETTERDRQGIRDFRELELLLFLLHSCGRCAVVVFTGASGLAVFIVHDRIIHIHAACGLAFFAVVVHLDALVVATIIEYDGDGLFILVLIPRIQLAMRC